MKDTTIFLQHILDSIEKIEDYTKDKTKKDFLKDTLLEDAVIKRIEIIGEAAKNIPKDFRKKHEEIPWSEMSKTRDKLIHGYFGVDLDLTWEIIKHDLPELKKKITIILEETTE